MNPQIYEQQVHGGIAQGLGYALSEEFDVEDGKARTPDFFTYIMPTAADIPEIESVAVELYEPTGPFGLKGVGEVSTNGPLPVVANAVADACGIRVLRSPPTAERVFGRFAKKKGRGLQSECQVQAQWQRDTSRCRTRPPGGGCAQRRSRPHRHKRVVCRG